MRRLSLPESRKIVAPPGVVTANAPVAEITAEVMPSSPMLIRTKSGSAYAGAAPAGSALTSRIATTVSATRRGTPSGGIPQDAARR